MFVIYVGDSRNVYKRIITNHYNGNVEASALRRYIAEAMGFNVRRQRRSSGSVRVRIDLPDPHYGENEVSDYVLHGMWKILLLDDYGFAHDFQWYLIEDLKPLLNRDCKQYNPNNFEEYNDLMQQLTDSPFITYSALDQNYSGPGIYVLYHQRKPLSSVG